jgi:transmembrane sensor
MNNFKIDDLIIRYLSGETSSSENLFIQDWIKLTEDNKSYFISFRNIWMATAQVQCNEINLALLNSESELNPVKSSKDKLKRIVFYRMIEVAAVITIFLLTGSLVYSLFSDKQLVNYQNDVAVEAIAGSKTIITLPDGTKVWLNGGSKLTYGKNYNTNKREVFLVGEAYFNVVTNPSTPFIVQAGILSIKAIGTSFNVKAYPEDKFIVTTLVKGKVIIEGKDQMNKCFTVFMQPNETVSYSKDPIENIVKNEEKNNNITHEHNKTIPLVSKELPVTIHEEVKTELFTSWKDERWIIESQNIENLVKDLERRYNLKIAILSPSIKKFHFTGIIQNETIEQIMEIMRHTIPMKYTIEKGLISIKEDKKLMNEFYLKN